MKRIVKAIHFRPLYAENAVELPMVKGTGSMDMTVEKTEAGLVYTYNLTARLDQDSISDIRELTAEAVVTVTYDNLDVVVLGTEDLPAVLTPSRQDALGINCTWAAPEEPL